ncbi:MAG: hypothetical protein AAFQ82_21065 [Myxococcota bacterium]
MIESLHLAGELAGEGEDARQQFVELAQLAFNTHDLFEQQRARGNAPWGRLAKEWLRERGRDALGAGHRPAGAAVETAYSQTIQRLQDGPESFNPNVVEWASPRQSLTHHYAEFVLGAFERPDFLMQEAQRFIDHPLDNPGDYRSGMFAIMVGGGLERGRLTIEEAIELTDWAYSADTEFAPPWGREDLGHPSLDEVLVPTYVPGAGGYVHMIVPPGYYLTPGEYRLEDWLSAYREAHTE